MKKLFIIVAAMALVSFATFTIAAEWNFYGSARMMTWRQSSDKEYNGTAYDDDDTVWDLQGNSRLGAVVKAGDVGGGFEFGVYGPSGYRVREQVRTRKLFGTWNFGAGTLLVGQTYTPTFVPISNQVWGEDADLFGYGGMIGSCRNPMIQVEFSGLKIALVRPEATNFFGYADTDTKLPKIEASYSMKFGGAGITFFGGYNSYTLVDERDEDFDMDSYLAGVVVKFATGPVFVNGNVWMGNNVGAYGYNYPLGVSSFMAGPAWMDPEDYDVDYLGYALVAGFKLNDMVIFEAGYGAINSEANKGSNWEDDACSYYVNATINLAKGVFIVPEFGVIDKDDVKYGTSASADQGKMTYFGAKWQINF